MASAPAYAATPVLPSLTQGSTANTNRDGTGTLVTAVTGADPNQVIEQVVIQATGNTTQGMIRFFESIDAGATKKLILEVPVVAVTPSGVQQAFSSVATAGQGSGLAQLIGKAMVGANHILYWATNNAEQFNVEIQMSSL